MLPPHELDSVFESIENIDATMESAISSAKEAYAKAAKEIEANPNVPRGSAAQAARVAFLESLGI